jgi:peptidoglycan-N-acetylglucosamine deacetylase
MEIAQLRVVQCWDDGVVSDIRLVDLLRRVGAKASFNLNPALHTPARQHETWVYKNAPVGKLGWDEVRDVYHGFTIANHTMTHPRLDEIPIDRARTEITDARKRLQDHFDQPVLGFAYPFGRANEAVAKLVGEAGHTYGRLAGDRVSGFDAAHPQMLQPTTHFLHPDFWPRYESARPAGVFYLWGHSYELLDDAMWAAFEETLHRINADPNAEWAEVCDAAKAP